MDSGIMINLNLRPSPLNADDAVIKETWVKQYPLKPFLEAANFKSYDDLKEKLNRVISGSKNTETASEIDLPPTTGGTAGRNGNNFG